MCGLNVYAYTCILPLGYLKLSYIVYDRPREVWLKIYGITFLAVSLIMNTYSQDVDDYWKLEHVIQLDGFVPDNILNIYAYHLIKVFSQVVRADRS